MYYSRYNLCKTMNIEQSNFDRLYKLKCIQPWKPNVSSWWDYEIYATTTVDIEMHVWNGKHHPSVQDNTTTHTCYAGTRVRVWMVSRFGDCGITDNLTNPHGYNARVDADTDLTSIEFILVKGVEWFNPDLELPQYYATVYARLVSGEIVTVWRASNDSGYGYIWTIFGTSNTVQKEDIKEWRHMETTKGKIQI